MRGRDAPPGPTPVRDPPPKRPPPPPHQAARPARLCACVAAVPLATPRPIRGASLSPPPFLPPKLGSGLRSSANHSAPFFCSPRPPLLLLEDARRAPPLSAAPGSDGVVGAMGESVTMATGGGLGLRPRPKPRPRPRPKGRRWGPQLHVCPEHGGGRAQLLPWPFTKGQNGCSQARGVTPRRGQAARLPQHSLGAWL